MKKKIDEFQYIINDKLSKAANKIQNVEDGFVGCLVVIGIMVVSYTFGYHDERKSK